MKRPKTLSAAFVKTVNTPGRFGDGRGGFGLSLLVQKTANGRWSKTWSQRLRIAGKPVNIGLGSYPAVTLSVARDRALQNARAAQEGRDPRGKGIPTFQEAAEAALELQAQGWRGGKTESLWRNTLATYADPKIGHRRIDDLKVADVLESILPIWFEKPALAKKFRVMLSIVFRWAIAHGYRQDDPAHAVTAILPKQNGKTKHHKAVPYAKVGEALGKVRDVTAAATAKLALEFVILTAARSGEVRGATWAEIDLKAGVWIIPAERMKAGKEHRVPLSAAAMGVLRQARRYQDDSGLVFPSIRGRVQTDAIVSGLLRDAGIAGTVHGFRSSFRDWCGETGQPRELAELALAHSIGNGVEQAYARSDLLAKRRDLMEAWAAHVFPSKK